MTSGGRVRLERAATADDGVAHLVLDDPSRRNTMGMAMYAAVPALIAEVNDDPHVRVLVVRGEGTTFSAGSDITEFRAQRLGDAHVHYAEVEHRAPEALASCRVPVVAAIRGACMGGGLSIALAADLRYAASDTLFSVPPGRLGVGYPLAAIDRLVATIGRAAATDLLLTARRFGADEALRIGLVHDVAAAGQLDDLMADRCATIASLAPMTLRAARAALAGQPDAAALADACFHSTDLVEGITAFEESRYPSFNDR